MVNSNTRGCKYPECKRNSWRDGLCYHHFEKGNRIEKTITSSGEVKESLYISEAQRQSEFRQPRKRVLNRYKRCQFPGCDERSNTVHHIDTNRHNHAESNLMALCPLCHKKIHALIRRGIKL